MSVSQRIREKLEAALAIARLEVKDESHLHAGHAGAPEGGESHFRLTLVAQEFEGMSRVARQRLVNDILKDELDGPVHALAMKTIAPSEQESAAHSR